MYHRYLVCRLACIILISGLATHAQEVKDSSKDGVSANAAKATLFAGMEGKRYDIRHKDQGATAFKLIPQPVLRWSNPVRGEVHGAVVLWTSDGCPEAVASIYEFFDRQQINIELVSLSESALVAKRNQKVRWTPGPGLKFVTIPDGPEPADTPAKRQLQTRSLARKFSASLEEPNNDGNWTVLRLMARPLYQYQSTAGPERDGAVFAFVTTTDPEILLVIESRATSQGREWVYAAARMHFRPLKLKLEDKVVWEAIQAAPPWDKIRGPEGEYVILQWATEEEAARD
jgi:hypothetical protein